jgi:hypothetical protein
MRLTKCAVLAIIVCVASASNTASQQLTASDQLNKAIDGAKALCETVKEARGGKTVGQLQADLQAKAPGFWKLFDIGGGAKGSIDRETFEGLTQEATAAAVAADRDCRKEMMPKLFEMLSTQQATPAPQVRSAPEVKPAAAPEVKVAPQMQATPQVPSGGAWCDTTSNVMLRANKPLPDICCGYASGSCRRGDFLVAPFVMEDQPLSRWRDNGPCKCLSSGIEGKYGVWVKQ